ncbi:ShlB/FhaC/HecB family hemolysin secretion/activation protein [Salmonella enterica]|nr:ShlB/FhaC/HecB family hemolysin secretion/activation protein [Salmonella enterica]EGL7480248.1 ShlB/FhaC/HecB family hemolysin secretion/activation protein [Salmonella enterica]EIZ2335200.1 ShlB/FhaC/HecB family hemolysin secretion/activation protein [Salmonella enterica]
MKSSHRKVLISSPRRETASGLSLSALCLACSVSAMAAEPPSAGALGNQLRQEHIAPPVAPVQPALVLPAGPAGHSVAPSDSTTTVVVKRVIFSGLEGTGVTEGDAQAAVAGMTGRPLTFRGLQALAGRVTTLLHSRDMLLAQAILPPQTISGGILHIQVVPGRYDAAAVHNASALRTAVIQRMVQATTPEGEVVRRGKLERVALLLNEIPGVDAGVTLKEGQKNGTSAMDITVRPGKRTGGYIGLDNQGDPSTGRSRVMAGFYANELLGLGDQLRVDLLDAYERSDLFNGALDYSLLAGGYGTRLGVNYSHLNYHYNLSGEGFNGYSDNWGLYATQPWIRTARARVDVRIDAGQQFLTDRYPQVFAQALSDGDKNGRKRVSSGTLSLLGSVAGVPGGLSAFTVRGTVGNMDYRNDTARAFSGADTRGATGQFSRLNYMLSHDQQVWGPFSVYAGLNGQMADHNLDASQKFLMGGPTAVRAYDIGDGAVDDGNVATAEVRSDWTVPGHFWPGSAPKLTLAAFYDQGWGEQYKDNHNQAVGGRLADRHNRFSLAGAGLYATVADAGNYALTLTWARRTGDADPVSGHDDSDRFWVSAVKTF